MFSFVETCLQNRTIEKSYSNPTSLELFEERLGFMLHHEYSPLSLYRVFFLKVTLIENASQNWVREAQWIEILCEGALSIFAAAS